MKMTSVEKHFVNSRARKVAVANNVMELLGRIAVAAGGRLLDVGCGVGSAAGAIAERGDLHVVGVDVDPAQIAAARASATRPNLEFRVMDATKLEFADESFDVVTSSMATHHIPRWEQAVAEMIRVLRPGGYLVYIDLVFPRWLARAGWMLRPLMALPTAVTVDELAKRNSLVEYYRRQKGMQLNVIYRRSN
jgi:ubiquinone/menaquinone biosynthesis C-methylase UbiE